MGSVFLLREMACGDCQLQFVRPSTAVQPTKVHQEKEREKEITEQSKVNVDGRIDTRQLFAHQWKLRYLRRDDLLQCHR